MADTTAVKGKWRTVDLAYTALFAVLMTVCAWISVPLPVPFTLQTFAICAAMGVLGGRRSTWAVAVYLLLGAVAFRCSPVSVAAWVRCWAPPAGIFWVFWPCPWYTGW